MMPLRARDVRVIFKEKGAERGACEVLEKLIEEFIGIRQVVAEMVAQHDRMVNMLGAVIQGTGQMKTDLDRIKKHNEKFDGMMEGEH